MPDQRSSDGQHVIKRWETRTYATATQGLDDVRIEEELSEQGAVVSRVYKSLRLRYVVRYEMEHLLALAGFEVEALYGGFGREPFDEAAREFVWVARRPA